MTLTDTRPPTDTKVPVGRKFGYVVAIAVNAAMWYVAAHLLEWGWPTWLTSEFNDVLPWIAFSLTATIVVNAIYISDEPAWFRSLTKAGLGVISIAVTLRVLRIFPFDFSAYDGPWHGLTEAVLILAIAGSAITGVTQVALLFTRLVSPDQQNRHDPSRM